MPDPGTTVEGLLGPEGDVAVGEMPPDGEPMMHIEPPEISLGDDELGPGARRPVERLPAPQQEDWSVGPVHWAAILAAGFAVWRYVLHGGGSSRTSGSAAAAAHRPDADELRRKRLEAFERSGSATMPAAPSSPQGGDGEGLKRRSVGISGEASPEVEKKTPAATQEPTAAAAAAARRAEAAAAEAAAARERAAEEVSPAPSPPAPEPAAEAPAAAATAPAPVAEAPTAAPLPTPAAKAPAAEPAPTPAAEVPTPAAEAPKADPAPAAAVEPEAPGAVAPEEFSVQLRSTLQGVTATRIVEGLCSWTTVATVRELAQSTFGVDADARIRLFFKGRELKASDAELGTLGIVAGATIQVMVAAAAAAPASGIAAGATGSTPTSPTAAAAPEQRQPLLPSAAGADTAAASSTAAGEQEPSAPAVSLRVQGSVQGTTAVHMLEDIAPATTVAALEERILATFNAGGMRLRLFYMGRELKDPEKTVGSVGFKAGAMLQAMFSAGKPRTRNSLTGAPASASSPVDAQPAEAASSGAAVPPPDAGRSADLAAAASAVAAAVNSVQQGGEGTTTEAAAGSPAALLANGSGSPASGAGVAPEPAPVSPEEAWQAMAGVEEQLSRAADAGEAQEVRNASMVLRQMLTTVTHGENPALMQFAQAAVPDLSKIWAFGPTREHLRGLLVAGMGETGAGSAAGATAGGSAEASSSTS